MQKHFEMLVAVSCAAIALFSCFWQNHSSKTGFPLWGPRSFLHWDEVRLCTGHPACRPQLSRRYSDDSGTFFSEVVHFLLKSMLLHHFFIPWFSIIPLFHLLLFFGSFIVVGPSPPVYFKFQNAYFLHFLQILRITLDILNFGLIYESDTSQNAMFLRQPISHFFAFLPAIAQRSEFFMLGCFSPRFSHCWLHDGPLCMDPHYFQERWKAPPPKVSWTKVEANPDSFFWRGK